MLKRGHAGQAAASDEERSSGGVACGTWGKEAAVRLPFPQVPQLEVPSRHVALNEQDEVRDLEPEFGIRFRRDGRIMSRKGDASEPSL